MALIPNDISDRIANGIRRTVGAETVQEQRKRMYRDNWELIPGYGSTTAKQAASSIDDDILPVVAVFLSGLLVIKILFK